MTRLTYYYLIKVSISIKIEKISYVIVIVYINFINVKDSVA